MYLTDVVDNKELVHWTDVRHGKIMRYNIHHNKVFVYLTDVVHNKIMTYFITHCTFTNEVPLASSSVNAWFDPRSG